MNAVHIPEPDNHTHYQDQPLPQATAHRPATLNQRSRILYCAVNPEQLLRIQQNNWQFPLESSSLLTSLRPLSDQHTAEDMAQQWHVQKSGAGFVIAFRVNAEFLNTLSICELMGEQGDEFHISAPEIAPLNENMRSSISLLKAFYSNRIDDEKLPDNSHFKTTPSSF